MKKFNFKALIIAVLIFSMMLSLVACMGNKKPDDTTADTSDSNYLDIIKDGKCAKIVYATTSTTEKSIAEGIKDIISRATGYTPECSYSKTYNANTVEIVVGDVGYPETDQVKETLGYGESVIKVVGKKIVIIGYDSTSLKSAADTFTTFINSNLDNKNLRIGTNYESIFAPNKLISELPTLKGWSPTIVNTGDNCYMMKFGKGSAAESRFRSYLKVLESNGYTLYASNKIEDNEYYTYVNDKIVINAIYTKYNKSAKLLVEWLTSTALPTKAEDNKYTPVAGLTSSITQVGLFYDVQIDSKGAMTNFNGMCYAIRLDDGSFIVVDGGHGKAAADNLYKVLAAQAPDPNNIVIAAWVFSHDHGDHTGAFDDFATTYGKKVKVESFIYNFPSKDQGNDDGVANSVRGLISAYFKGATFTKAHPGQVFNIRNAKITMLYTMDVYDEKDTLVDTNDASIVWQMELEGKTFMCLGDYSENGYHLLKLYTEKTLGSDIVQIAHHGISGQNTEGSSIYDKITPEYAFWPVGAKHVIFYSNGGMPDLQLDREKRNTYFIGTAANNYTDPKMDPNKIYWAFDDMVVMTIDNGNVSTTTYTDINNFLANYNS